MSNTVPSLHYVAGVFGFVTRGTTGTHYHVIIDHSCLLEVALARLELGLCVHTRPSHQLSFSCDMIQSCFNVADVIPGSFRDPASLCPDLFCWRRKASSPIPAPGARNPFPSVGMPSRQPNPYGSGEGFTTCQHFALHATAKLQVRMLTTGIAVM